jgi:phosphate transport system substrate-binding protein
MRLLLPFLFVAMCLPPTAHAREQIRVVGSSTVFPFIAAVAEQFGREGEFRTPIVEATGTGGGFKTFCGGVGEEFPDISNASRPIKPSETELCRKHGIDTITELQIGYDGIVVANARGAADFLFTRAHLFLAMARDVPQNGKLVQNPYKNWREIDKNLPDLPIVIYGSPPTSGTRDAFVEMVMHEACKQFPEYAAAYPNAEDRKHHCSYMREDGVLIEAGENGNLIIQKLLHNEAALGIFGYSYLEQNEALVKANPIEGALPNFTTITSGQYRLARSLFVYVKLAHATLIPGLKEFITRITSDAATGSDGYLVMRGLLPLSPADHAMMKKRAGEI